MVKKKKKNHLGIYHSYYVSITQGQIFDLSLDHANHEILAKW